MEEISQDIFDFLPLEIITMILRNLSLQDLINFYKVNKYSNQIIKSINWEQSPIPLSVPPELSRTLKKLDKLVGLVEIKSKIMKQIFDIYTRKITKEDLNTEIIGRAGAGKTLIIKILLELYFVTGMITNKRVTYIERHDFGKYSLQTEILLQKKITESFGGILVIEDILNLSGERFMKLIYLLYENFVQNAGKFICFIVNTNEYAYDGELYVNLIEKHFKCKYLIKGYNINELCQIFINKINEHNYKLDFRKEILEKFFLDHKVFDSNTANVLTLFYYLKHFKNIESFCECNTDFCEHNNNILITIDNVNDAINNLIKNSIKMSSKSQQKDNLF